MTADAVDIARRDMGMPLAADDPQVLGAIRKIAIAQDVPMVIYRMNAANIRMTIQNRGEPIRGSASPRNNAK
jgi:hypothetical protein